jgi:hypothetical protein
VVIGTDCIGRYKSNYYLITTTTAPLCSLCYMCIYLFDCYSMYYYMLFANKEFIHSFINKKEYKNVITQQYNNQTTPILVHKIGLGFHFQQYFSYIVSVSFIGGGNRRKSPTCRKSLTNFITYCCIEYTSP